MLWYLRCLVLLIPVLATGQHCKETGTIVFVRNTGIIFGGNARIYLGDSLIFKLHGRECQVLELRPGTYYFKCSFGSIPEGVKYSEISVTVGQCSTSYVQFFMKAGKGNMLPSSGYRLKMAFALQPKTVNGILSKRFVKKKMSLHLFSLVSTSSS